MSDRLREIARKVLDEIDALAAESHGVAGLHLNGDVADWAWLYDSWLPSLAALRAESEEGIATGCGATQCDGRCRSEEPPKRCDACGKGTCATWFGIDGKARCWSCEVSRG